MDSIYIQETEGRRGKDKVLHAEPLYIDLIRDLGARKGEKEWNIGFGLTDNQQYDRYTALIEYEFAPVEHICEPGHAARHARSRAVVLNSFGNLSNP